MDVRAPLPSPAVFAKPRSTGAAWARGYAFRLRRARVLRVQRLARRQGRIYHLTGPLALARDFAIKAMGPKRMLARQDWIYDWRA